MPRPISEDLRWRIVWFSVFLGHSAKEIARNLCISERSVERIVAKYLATADVKPEKVGRPIDSVAFTDDEQLVLIESILEHPEKELSDIARDVSYVLGNSYAYSTIHYYLKRNGITRKKLKIIAVQQSERLRVEFIANVMQLEPDMLVFLDESGFDRHISRGSGYSLRGYPAEVKRLRCNWSPRLTVIPIVCTGGFLDIAIHRGTTDRQVFLAFVQNHLAPNLLPFNGTNPRSVVIMDNAAIHHCREVIDAIQATGAVVLFLPPYSPDLMPCEGMFSKAKAWLRSNDVVWQTCNDPETMVLDTFMQISHSDILQYLRHSEYL